MKGVFIAKVWFESFAYYFIQRSKYLDPTEVKDDQKYRRIIKIIQDRIKS